MTGDSLVPAEEPLEGRVVDPRVPLSYGCDHWPAFAVLPGREDVVLEGVVVTVDDGGALDEAVRLRIQAAAEAAARAGLFVWHDEAGRLEERGRLDRAGCECADCLGDKYSGEEFY